MSWLTDLIGVNISAKLQELQAIGGNTTVINIVNLINRNSFYLFVTTKTAETLEHILFACLVYIVVCLGLYKLLFLVTFNGDNVNRLPRLIKSIKLPSSCSMKRVLFVTSHPDDECMFFGPLIYTLTQRDVQVHILCLSNGNYENKSHLRRQELWSSCAYLGIPSSNIMLLNATHLPDDPYVEWQTESVAKYILNMVESLDIDAVITYDRDGVSQHPNHSAVYYATASLCLAHLLPKNCKFFTLDSVNTLRKYISILDLICTCFMSTNWCILSWRQAAIIRSAMKEHKSQMKWFRWLYIYFSRYMFINSFREVNLSDVELEMQIHDH
ncbi:N-acetylglucosaminyl-phosphatidylinositol de-N-acetylase [Teleopsis dalmanni]|uniref:N-acetylglucosaminyl-phosphatidylinositol de-N-acetylase n=1 Tax=Teleopsis dalmanni TaxID=139649 RepID=UPI0018CD1AC2|nr:N-acetylglucosaminyl-phosphatidylinositol de-N-acetylase [Teleopsis dalmanni]